MSGSSATIAAALALAGAAVSCTAGPAAVVADAGPPPPQPDSGIIDQGITDELACATDRDFDNPVWKLNLSQAAWGALNQDIRADVEVEAILVAEGRTYEVEVEYQGRAGRTWPKRSFRLKFSDHFPLRGDPYGDGGQVQGFHKVLLKAMYVDQSLVREALAFAVSHRMQRPAPRVGFANLILDGRYWGLYALVEPVDTTFFLNRGYVLGGSLYKAVDQKADFRPGRVLTEAFVKKTNVDEPWDDLIDLVNLFRGTQRTHEAFYRDLDPIFPLEAYYDRLIWASGTQNYDGMTHNYYLYREPRPDGDRWVTIPWDSDIAFGQHWLVTEPTFDHRWQHMLHGKNDFAKRLISVDELRHEYTDRYEAALDTYRSPDALGPMAERMFVQVGRDLACDIQRWERPSTVEQEFDEIRHFIEARPRFMRQVLQDFRGDPDVPDLP